MLKRKKYRREIKANPPRELPWLLMLTVTDHQQRRMDNEIMKELEEFAMNEQEIREALIEWETLSANKENKALYEAGLKFLRDQLTNIRGERRKGIEEGIEIGIEKGVEKGIQQGIRHVAIKPAKGRIPCFKNC